VEVKQFLGVFGLVVSGFDVPTSNIK